MKIPQKVSISILLPVIAGVILTVIVSYLCSFETAVNVLNCAAVILGLPVAIDVFSKTLLVLNENKVLMNALLEARKKTEEQWEEDRKRSMPPQG